MKRTSLIACGLLALSLCGLIGYGRPDSGLSRIGKRVTISSQERQPSAGGIKTFVPSGLPLIFSDPRLNKQVVGKGPEEQLFELRVNVAAVAGEEITTVNLVLFEFDPAGALRRVDGWIKEIEPTTGQGAELVLQLNRKLHPEKRLILTAERVYGPARKWELDYLDLARGAAADAGGRERIPFVKQEQPEGVPAGAAMCSEAFRRAMELVKAGDGQSVTSFTCDQTERTYRFTFPGKML